jgi:DNA invertase Pin-like site-specific DNA recombinase
MEEVTMKDAIGYLRVSTTEQGRSGLGLAAQRIDIEAFGSREGFVIKNCYQDIQIAAGKDELSLRPGLAAALKQARAVRAPLIVSRLDRLSRNVHFITGLMEHKIHFVVAALGTFNTILSPIMTAVPIERVSINMKPPCHGLLDRIPTIAPEESVRLAIK